MSFSADPATSPTQNQQQIMNLPLLPIPKYDNLSTTELTIDNPDSFKLDSNLGKTSAKINGQKIIIIATDLSRMVEDEKEEEREKNIQVIAYVDGTHTMIVTKRGDEKKWKKLSDNDAENEKYFDLFARLPLTKEEEEYLESNGYYTHIAPHWRKIPSTEKEVQEMLEYNINVLDPLHPENEKTYTGKYMRVDIMTFDYPNYIDKDAIIQRYNEIMELRRVNRYPFQIYLTEDQKTQKSFKAEVIDDEFYVFGYKLKPVATVHGFGMIYKIPLTPLLMITKGNDLNFVLAEEHVHERVRKFAQLHNKLIKGDGDLSWLFVEKQYHRIKTKPNQLENTHKQYIRKYHERKAEEERRQKQEENRKNWIIRAKNHLKNIFGKGEQFPGKWNRHRELRDYWEDLQEAQEAERQLEQQEPKPDESKTELGKNPASSIEDILGDLKALIQKYE